jgi:hypothetical protein
VIEQPQRVGAFPLGVGVGEVFADVAKTCCTEQSVGDRMSNGVGIAMTMETSFAVEAHTTEDQRTIGVVTESVDVEPLADTNVVHLAT